MLGEWETKALLIRDTKASNFYLSNAYLFNIAVVFLFISKSISRTREGHFDLPIKEFWNIIT